MTTKRKRLLKPLLSTRPIDYIFKIFYVASVCDVYNVAFALANGMRSVKTHNSKIIFQKIYTELPKNNTLANKVNNKEDNLQTPQYDLDLIERIVEPYLDNLPFLKPGFSLYQFAEETKLPSHQLSYFLKVKYDQSFNDFKNYNRVMYAIKQIDSGIAKNHTLETISLNCGFRSRTNFVDAFKKVTGKTPSDYLKK